MAKEEESLEERLKGGKKETEPTYFFRRDQINENVYEYAESKDVYVKGTYESSLIFVEKKDATVQGYGGKYFKDTKQKETLSKLKRKAVTEAKKLCIELGYDSLFIDDKDINMEFLGCKEGDEPFIQRFGSPDLTYSLTAVVEFYRKKTQQGSEDDSIQGIKKRLAKLEKEREEAKEILRQWGKDIEKHAEKLKEIEFKKPEEYKGK